MENKLDPSIPWVKHNGFVVKIKLSDVRFIELADIQTVLKLCRILDSSEHPYHVFHIRTKKMYDRSYTPSNGNATARAANTYHLPTDGKEQSGM